MQMSRILNPDAFPRTLSANARIMQLPLSCSDGETVAQVVDCPFAQGSSGWLTGDAGSESNGVADGREASTVHGSGLDGVDG